MLYFVTGNAGKFREIQAIIPGIEQLKLELDEIQSLDPQVVIEHKLAQAAMHHKGEFIVEDTTLDLNCLGGSFPGTMVKWFELSLGLDGVADLVSRYDDHGAVGRVTIGYRDGQGETHYFVGSYSGKIVAPRGDNGFGWDKIFIADGQTKTNAELSAAQKQAISARALATRKLTAHLEQAAQA